MNRLYRGDCLKILRRLPDCSVQCCVTSPPYWGLRDYGTAKWQGGDAECDHAPRAHQSDAKSNGTGALRDKPGQVCKCGARRIDRQLGLEPTPSEYVASMVEVFREVRRVLRPDGTLWLNLGDSFGPGKQLLMMPHRLALALQADGWIIRMDCVWHKPNPMPESVRDRPTKAHEYIFLLSKSARYFWDSTAVAERSVETKRGLTGGRYSPPGQTPHGNARVKPAATFASLGRSALIPELDATVHTDDGSTSSRGWVDFGKTKDAIVFPMTRKAQSFQIFQPVGLKIGIETPEGFLVVDLKAVGRTALDASIPVSLASRLALLGPIGAAIADASPLPCGAVLTGHVGTNPDARTLARAEVTSLECALVPGELFAARLTLQSEELRATFLVWSTLWSRHVSLLSDGHNIIGHRPYENKRNCRSVWTIPPRTFRGAHFATFPPALVERCIKAGTSERGACPQCGKAWERVTEHSPMILRRSQRTHSKGRTRSSGTMLEPSRSKTLGFRPACTCPTAPAVPCVVLDPFIGSGTTAAVAQSLGRDCIGIDLNPQYLTMARQRIKDEQKSVDASAGSPATRKVALCG